MINQKYSYGGYDPLSAETIARKAERKATLLAAKQTHARVCADLRRALEMGQCTEDEYKAGKFNADREALDAQKAHSAGISAMKSPFKDKTFLDVDPTEFSNTEIVGTGFAQREPHTKVFPDGVTGLTLTNCNADNVTLPTGTVCKNTTNKQIKTQNDGEYWTVDKALKPVEPREKARYIELGLSTDPKDIPVEPVEESVLIANDPRVIEQRAVDEKKQDDEWIKEKLQDDGTLPRSIGEVG